MQQKILIFIIIAVFNSCREDSFSPIYEPIEDRTMAGGETTFTEVHSNAFSMPAPNLTASELEEHLEGDKGFEDVFIMAPSNINSGLGPIFNHNSCIACHPKDGRSKFSDNLDAPNGFFLRTSIPGTDETGGPLPTPGFGLQIQNQAIWGYQPEAKIQVTFRYKTETLADGTKVQLREPIFTLKDAYIPFPKNAMISPRMPMPVFGLGLVEAIPESRLLSLQDIDDTDGDGISGKANFVWNPITKKTELGRFGWKANTANVMLQTAGAYTDDMGVTNPVFHQEPGLGQSNGYDRLKDDPEIDSKTLNAVVKYCRTLAVPAARKVNDPKVNNGYKIFVNELECAKCHTPSHTTGKSDVATLANQKIWPFSDFLLHDMGESLADHRPDFLADGREWRTRPLWGLGLTFTVNGHYNLLHDGRARSITEAILWHDGEAMNSKNKFKKLSAKKRNDLLAFLNSL